MYNIKFSRRYPRVVVPIPRNFANVQPVITGNEPMVIDDTAVPISSPVAGATVPLGMLVGALVPFLGDHFNMVNISDESLPYMMAGGAALGTIPGLAMTYGQIEDDKRRTEQQIKAMDVTGRLLQESLKQDEINKRRRR